MAVTPAAPAGMAVQEETPRYPGFHYLFIMRSSSIKKITPAFRELATMLCGTEAARKLSRTLTIWAVEVPIFSSWLAPLINLFVIPHLHR
jgi:hypothetical protein